MKLKIPDEEEPQQFTGLTKEELLRVAGTPGWRRTRWSLLILFWLSWLGILAAAVLIILKAPPCRAPPSLSWWNEAPLYRVRSLQDFSEAGNIRGVEQSLEHLIDLKVKGLVVGPVHVSPKDEPVNLSFEEVSAESGSLDQMKNLLQSAHKKGLMVVLDLTPNYLGANVWFSNSSISSICDRLKSALVFWLTLGVDGVKLDSVDLVSTLVPSQWNDIRVIVQSWNDTARPHKRLLLGSAPLTSPDDIITLISDSGVNLLISPGFDNQTDATERAQTVQLLNSAHGVTRLLWSLGPAGDATEQCRRSDLIVLLTLPGNALIQSGDEGQIFPKPSESEQNQTQDSSSSSSPCLVFLSTLSTLRSKERSLKFGDFSVVYNSSSALVYLRSWDESPRFLVLMNSSPDLSFSMEAVGGALGELGSGASGQVVLSSSSSSFSPNSDLKLNQVQLGPGESVLMKLQQA